MNDTVITAVGLGKSYLIGHQGAAANGALTLRDTLAEIKNRAVRSVVDLAKGRPILAGDEIEEFWALKDVSFEIPKGEVVGIVGRNGAGKSTLLKVLSRITEPTRGRIEICGRVASLLEVGTGFHPELTGRENIFLNGAILGMSRKEIKCKFDNIVQFAQIERFLDTPVKRYSSGMYVRLAFAVAAHLEPEILIIDEVLAVGDAGFQRRCLEKITEISTSGKTVLFVSHNLQSVRALCHKALWLDSGKVRQQGTVEEVLEAYVKTTFNQNDTAEHYLQSTATAWVQGYRYTLIENENTNQLPHKQLRFEFDVQSRDALTGCSLQIGIRDQFDQKVAHLSSILGHGELLLKSGSNQIVCDVTYLPLYPSVYYAHVALVEGTKVLHSLTNAMTIDLTELKHYPNNRMPDYGPTILPQEWQFGG